MADDLQHLTGNAGDDGLDVTLEDTLDDTTQTTYSDDDTEDDGDTGGNAEHPNQKKPLKTPEELDEARRAALNSFFQEKNKVKEARAQLDEFENELLALAKDDVSIIDKIYERNPERADKLTQALFNMTYKEALQKAQETQTGKQDGSLSQAEIDALVEQKVNEVLGRKDQAVTQTEVQKELDKMLASTGLNPTGHKFKRLMAELKELGVPQTTKQARAYFLAAQEALKGSQDDMAVDMGSVPTLSQGQSRSQSRIPMPSDAYFKAAELNGRSRQEALKAWKSLQEKKLGGIGL